MNLSDEDVAFMREFVDNAASWLGYYESEFRAGPGEFDVEYSLVERAQALFPPPEDET